MSGYNTFNQWKRTEELANELGFRIANPKHSWGGSDSYQDSVAIYPKDDALPVYNRDAEIFCGTFSQLNTFLRGWSLAQEYDAMIRLSDDKKRKAAEDRERERQRIAALKLDQQKMWAILKDKKGEKVV